MSDIQDQAARDQAINTSKSVLLQAPAGSGKTELLSQRILALLARVENPEEILAITFTNKAANEMKHRVLRHLQLAQDEDYSEDLAPHELQSYKLAQKALKNNDLQEWDILNNANRLQIKTIDALNLSIVRRMPLLAQTGGLETVEPDCKALYQEAVLDTFGILDNNGDDADALYTVLAHFENNQFTVQNLLVKMLNKRDQWLRLGIASVSDYKALRQHLEGTWFTLVEDGIATLNEHLPHDIIASLNLFAHYQSVHLDTTFPDGDYGDDTLNDLHFVHAWHNLLFTKSGSLRSSKGITKAAGFPINISNEKETKAQFIAFLDTLRDDENLLQAIQQAATLPTPTFADAQWNMLQSLLHVLRLSVANLQLTFIKHAQVDFIEMGIRAAQALGDLDNPSHLAMYMDGKISHILVDEFQDTNHLQFDLLQKLTAHWQNNSQTFFAVGDPMQSIYRFREADVGLFLQAKNHGISNIPLDFLELSVNFRSTDTIVNWCNQRFAKIFPKRDNTLTGAVSYSDSVAQKTNDDSKVTFHGFISEDLNSETDAVIETLTALHNTDQTIGILLRKKSDLLDIAAKLKQQGIPFRATEMDRLNSLQVVEDIRNLTHAFVHWGNQAAWLAVLRAPWCGLTLKDLQALVDSNPDRLLWQNIPEALSLLSDDGQQRLQHILQVFNTAFALNTQFPLPQILKKLWVSLGGEHLLRYEHEQIAVDMAFTCIEDSLEPWGLDLTVFDENIASLFAPSHNEGNIECMTIHKSKGLEFDVVLLPKLGGRGRTGDQEILHWAETTDEQLLLAPVKATRDNEDPLYRYLHQLDRTKESFETMRLLYVAVTRAIDTLHLFGTVKPQAKGDPKPSAGGMLALLWAQESEHFIEVDSPNNDTETAVDIQLKRLPLRYLAESTIPDHHDVIETHSPNLDLSENTAATIGTVFHACCEQLCKLETKPEQASLEAFIKTKLQQHNINDITTTSSSVLTLLENMQSDATGQWLLKHNHQDSKQEWCLSTQQFNTTKHVILDRCFIDDETLWIVDYKTSALESGESNEDFIARMKENHSPQLIQYQNMVMPLTDLPIKLMIYCPAVPIAITI